MTTTALTQAPTVEADSAASNETVVRVPLASVIPNPDNIRRDLGDRDLDDLTRSVKASGVIVPLLVLPANSDGEFVIVAGHRRRIASIKAQLDTVPVLIRDLSPLQILDAMLAENGQRSDLAASDSVRAVARYQYLDPAATPTKIARRIGRTPAWVKTRLGIASLPTDLLDGLDDGTMTLATATALAAVTDLGDDAVRSAAQHLATTSRWNDPTETITRWRARYEAEGKCADLFARYEAKGGTVYRSSADARQAGAAELDRGSDGRGLDLDPADQKAHRREPCHAFCVTLDWQNKITVTGYCTDRKRHAGNKAMPAESPIAVPTNPDQQAARTADPADKAISQARQARNAAAATVFSTGKLNKATAIHFAAVALIDSLDQAAVKKANKWLGLTPGTDYGAADAALLGWLDNGDPARLLAVLAAAHLETRTTATNPLPSYHPTQRTASRTWLTILADSAGYTPTTNDLSDNDAE